MAKKKNSEDQQNGVQPANKAAGKPTADPKKGAPGGDKKAPAKKPSAKPGDEGPSFIEKARQFFREVRIELKKVTWPSRKETIASTSVILALVFLIAVFLGIIDIGLVKVLNLLLHRTP